MKVESLFQHLAKLVVVCIMGKGEGEGEVWVVEINVLSGLVL